MNKLVIMYYFLREIMDNCMEIINLLKVKLLYQKNKFFI